VFLPLLFYLFRKVFFVHDSESYDNLRKSLRPIARSFIKAFPRPGHLTLDLMIEFSPLQRTVGLRPAQKRRGKEEFGK